MPCEIPGCTRRPNVSGPRPKNSHLTVNHTARWCHVHRRMRYVYGNAHAVPIDGTAVKKRDKLLRHMLTRNWKEHEHDALKAKAAELCRELDPWFSQFAEGRKRCTENERIAAALMVRLLRGINPFALICRAVATGSMETLGAYRFLDTQHLWMAQLDELVQMKPSLHPRAKLWRKNTQDFTGVGGVKYGLRVRSLAANHLRDTLGVLITPLTATFNAYVKAYRAEDEAVHEVMRNNGRKFRHRETVIRLFLQAYRKLDPGIQQLYEENLTERVVKGVRPRPRQKEPTP